MINMILKLKHFWKMWTKVFLLKRNIWKSFYKTGDNFENRFESKLVDNKIGLLSVPLDISWVPSH